MKLFLLLIFSTFAYAQAPTPLNQINGTTRPIIGLFGESVPRAYFQKDLTEAYMSGDYHRGFINTARFQDGKILAYLANDTRYNHDVTISAVSYAKGLSQNYLVKVPGNGFVELDMDELRNYDMVFFLGFLSFQVQIDGWADPTIGESNVRIDAPTPKQQAIGISRCSYWNQNKAKMAVENSNGPAVGGSSVAEFSLGYVTTTHQLFLKVYYPAGSDNVYHEPAPMPSGQMKVCNPDANYPPQDIYYTRATNTAKRYIKWHGVGSAAKFSFNTGTALCLESIDDTNPDYTCLVDTDDDGILDTNATWDVYLPEEE